MKQLLFSSVTAVFLLLLVSDMHGQDMDEPDHGYNLAVQYTHEFVADGFVRVREWDLIGDKLKLQDLGMKNYSALQLRAEKRLRNNSMISLSYDQYFIRGSATFDHDILYNGTLIEGAGGIDVSPTRYFRLTAIYAHEFHRGPRMMFAYLGGLVFDHVVFYVDGKVSAASTKNEVYEGFGRQAFPFPFLGIRGFYSLASRSRISFETSGTYIPQFKSFYTEGGNIHLQYSNFLAELRYVRAIGSFELGVGGKLRYMNLFQESREDTNELRLLTGGPGFDAVYRF